MPRRDPTLIIRLRARRDRRPIGSNDRDLIAGIDLLGPGGGLFGAFGAFAAALFLREEGRDPGAVDEVAGAEEGGEEEEVEEYAKLGGGWVSMFLGWGKVGWSWDEGGKAYICGSKMLVSGSTTLTVSLKAWIV